VMFCDLVGSTALSARLDPEDLREVIGAYHRCVADTVTRFAGFVAKYMGDGVLIYFGYPEAHEDDAELAVRAGLAVINAVGRLAAPERLNVRLGIASGVVVVGDLIGTGAAQERGVVGETPNLAARLQGLAAPFICLGTGVSLPKAARLSEIVNTDTRDQHVTGRGSRCTAIVQHRLLGTKVCYAIAIGRYMLIPSFTDRDPKRLC
jgi:class 3 adenylate cyclase